MPAVAPSHAFSDQVIWVRLYSSAGRCVGAGGGKDSIVCEDIDAIW